MKRKRFYVFLAAEAVICFILSFNKLTVMPAYPTAAAFPYEQIAYLLRKLSLASAMGNAIAWVLYLVFCLLPVVVMGFIAKKRKLKWRDGLLGCLSILLLIFIYLMINPVFKSGQIYYPVVYGSCINSVLIGYLILCCLDQFKSADDKRLHQYLICLLCALAAIFIYIIFGSSARTLYESINELKRSNTGSDVDLGMSQLFLVMGWITDVLPYLLDVLVLDFSIQLVESLKYNPYSTHTVSLANQLASLSAIALAIVMLAIPIYNISQLIWADELLVTHHEIQIPLLSIILVLGAHLFSRYVKHNQRLKEDLDLFI